MTKIDRVVIEHLVSAVGYKLDLVLVAAGSPCQDLSQLNACRQGLAGKKSSLFYEVPRVIRLLKQLFRVPVEHDT